MTDKIQKIREEVVRLKSQLLRGACASQVAMETRCKEEAYNDVLAILDTMQEPVSDELEAEIKKAFLNNECSVTDAISLSAFTRIARHFANWQKQQMDEYLKDMSNEIDLIGD